MPEPNSIDKKHPVNPELRYTIYMSEDRHIMVKARVESPHIAQQIAVKYVDDAMPQNTMHVYDELYQRQVGYAYLAQDGSVIWKPEENPRT